MTPGDRAREAAAAEGTAALEHVAPAACADHADWVLRKVVEENRATFGSDDWTRIGLRAVEPSGEVVGGIAGSSHWAIGHVDHLWVQPERRGQGLGAALLAGASRVMHERGCHRVLLETYSFQDALPFYRHQGFEVVGVIEDHPVGHRMWTLSRTLP